MNRIGIGVALTLLSVGIASATPVRTSLGQTGHVQGMAASDAWVCVVTRDSQAAKVHVIERKTGELSTTFAAELPTSSAFDFLARDRLFYRNSVFSLPTGKSVELARSTPGSDLSFEAVTSDAKGDFVLATERNAEGEKTLVLFACPN
ncbi:MAG: hypothetical protein JKY65_13410 [Planctomycetes bacterium]|nr:hypothetical protein [Planctomycetota bacterium]